MECHKTRPVKCGGTGDIPDSFCCPNHASFDIDHQPILDDIRDHNITIAEGIGKQLRQLKKAKRELEAVNKKIKDKTVIIKPDEQFYECGYCGATYPCLEGIHEHYEFELCSQLRTSPKCEQEELQYWDTESRKLRTTSFYSI